MYLFANLRHSRELIRLCFNMLLDDTALLLFPVISLVTMAILVGALLVPTQALAETLSICGIVFMVPFFYVAIYSAIFYFQVALVGAVLKRLDGGHPTFSQSLNTAVGRGGMIVRFAGYVALMQIAQILMGVLSYSMGGRNTTNTEGDFNGLRWKTAMFLILPVLATGKGSSAAEAMEESTDIVKQTWGENVYAHTGLGSMFFAISFVVGLAVFGLFVVSGQNNASLNSFLLTFVFIYYVIVELISSTLSAVYSAVLYRYAKTGDVAPNFDIKKIETAFKPIPTMVDVLESLFPGKDKRKNSDG